MHGDDLNVPPQRGDQRLRDDDEYTNDHQPDDEHPNDHGTNDHSANDVHRDPYGRRDDVLVASSVETDRDTGPHPPPEAEQDGTVDDSTVHDSTVHDSTVHDSTGPDHLDPDHDATRDVTRDPLQDGVRQDGALGNDVRAGEPPYEDTPYDSHSPATVTAVEQVPAVEETPAHAAPPAFTLFDGDPAEVQSRWRDVQASFVDDPAEAVERADGLVGEVVETVTNALRSRTGELREHWKGGDGGTDTERLRQALREYRGVLEGLLALSGDKTTHSVK